MSDTPTTKEEREAIERVRIASGSQASTFLDFIHFLLDFNIIGYTAGFIIAVSASELFNSVGKAIVKTTMKTLRLSDYMGELMENLISFVIVVTLVFLIMYLVIQPIVTSRTIQKERKVKEVVKAAEERKIEQTAERVSSTGGQIDQFGSGYFMY
jgi:large-conductance mechanosensitive channel